MHAFIFRAPSRAAGAMRALRGGHVETLRGRAPACGDSRAEVGHQKATLIELRWAWSRAQTLLGAFHRGFRTEIFVVGGRAYGECLRA